MNDSCTQRVVVGLWGPVILEVNLILMICLVFKGIPREEDGFYFVRVTKICKLVGSEIVVVAWILIGGCALGFGVISFSTKLLRTCTFCRMACFAKMFTKKSNFSCLFF